METLLHGRCTLLAGLSGVAYSGPMAYTDPQPLTNPANAPSARFFGSIGITPGMRVLDVGCGNGDLSRYIARLVGPNGEVVAVDRNEGALSLLRSADFDSVAAPITCRVVDLADDLPDLGHFDAIVGRRVLMYLPDAGKTLERLASLGKPGAVMAFQEHARIGLPAGLGELALHRQLYNWGVEHGRS